MPNFLKKSVLGTLTPEDEQKTVIQAINDSLMKYKEIKMICKKTHIKPIYFIIFILICLIFICIGFLDKYITLALATIYPLYISYKTLQYKIGDKKPDNLGIYTSADKQKDVTQWLSYWVVYAIFINIEGLFGYFLKEIPFYFLGKIVFLLLCLLPQYQLAGWIYNNLIAGLFQKYHDNAEMIYSKFVDAIKANEVNKIKEHQKSGKKGNYQMFSNLINNISNEANEFQKEVSDLKKEAQKPQKGLDDSGDLENEENRLDYSGDYEDEAQN